MNILRVETKITFHAAKRIYNIFTAFCALIRAPVKQTAGEYGNNLHVIQYFHVIYV